MAMTEYRLEGADKIGLILLTKGIIDEKILEEALKIKQSEQGKNKRNLAQILVSDLKINHDTVFSEVSKLFAFRELNVTIEQLDKNKIQEIKTFYDNLAQNPDIAELLTSLKVIPFTWDEKEKDKIILATPDPTQRNILKLVFLLNLKRYEIVFLPLKVYDFLIKELKPEENLFLKQLEELQQQTISIDSEDQSLDEAILEQEISKSALVNLIEGCLVEGVRKGASDIHIIPTGPRQTAIYFRIDGLLQLWHLQDNLYPEAFAAVVKDRSRGLDRFEREKAQDGFIQREIDGALIRYRVSIVPIVSKDIKHKFESIVIRILDDRKVITDLNKLGLTGYAYTSFKKAIEQPQGMVILTGPTGSGKSTTLIAALHQVISPEVNVLTVEDPVEYVIKGARQLKIGPKMDFEAAIRAILRHDPDIVLVGEIRDKVTADIAVKLANTGHLTFSTLHTNDAPSAVTRLYRLGIEPFLLAYSVNIIVAQRLVRRLCPDCKQKYQITPEEAKSLELNYDEWKNYEIFRAKGCDKCGGTGYKGRLAIHEALYFTKEIREAVFKCSDEIDEELIRQLAKKDGMLTLRESGFEKVKLGMTSFEEVIANTTSDV